MRAVMVGGPKDGEIREVFHGNYCFVIGEDSSGCREAEYQHSGGTREDGLAVYSFKGFVRFRYLPLARPGEGDGRVR